MSVMGKKVGKRASMAFLFTTSALLLVLLISLSFPSPADAGRRPPPKMPIYVPSTPPKKSPPPVPKKPPHYVAYKPLKKPSKPKSPPPYKPDLTSAKFPNVSPGVLGKIAKGIGALGRHLRSPPPYKQDHTPSTEYTTAKITISGLGGIGGTGGKIKPKFPPGFFNPPSPRLPPTHA
ncbi:non-classical arabinogalactan protein 31-like [Papaver somniferum]|uniref:non-classical arabinogalactan protein 31-like n=1 Tax=Papaver somniferum TaxID=3469 RepID=UPI000E701EB6|nr:non-classical arabinogalactan protein 31-like [Papaver somniferum]